MGRVVEKAAAVAATETDGPKNSRVAAIFYPQALAPLPLQAVRFAPSCGGALRASLGAAFLRRSFCVLPFLALWATRSLTSAAAPRSMVLSLLAFLPRFSTAGGTAFSFFMLPSRPVFVYFALRSAYTESITRLFYWANA